MEYNPDTEQLECIYRKASQAEQKLEQNNIKQLGVYSPSTISRIRCPPDCYRSEKGNCICYEVDTEESNRTSKLEKDLRTIQCSELEDEQVVVVTYESTKFSLQSLKGLNTAVQSAFPNNKVLLVPNEANLSIMSKSHLKHLRDVIDNLLKKEENSHDK